MSYLIKLLETNTILHRIHVIQIWDLKIQESYEGDLVTIGVRKCVHAHARKRERERERERERYLCEW